MIVPYHAERRMTACAGKVRYGARTIALRALARIVRKGAVDPELRLGPGMRLVAYACRYCGGWHLGTSTPPPRARREAAARE